jgi:hypothetical protein
LRVCDSFEIPRGLSSSTISKGAESPRDAGFSDRGLAPDRGDVESCRDPGGAGRWQQRLSARPRAEQCSQRRVRSCGRVEAAWPSGIRVLDGKIGDFNEAQQRYLEAVGNGGIGLVYIAGHGVQVEGRSYLLPVDFSAANADGLAKSAISLPNLLDAVDKAKAKLSIVVLPFPATVAQTRGPSEVARPVPDGALVLYAASSNQTALDTRPAAGLLRVLKLSLARPMSARSWRI